MENCYNAVRIIILNLRTTLVIMRTQYNKGSIMRTVHRLPDIEGMTVKERFASLFFAYNDDSDSVTLEELICRNGRIVYENGGAIVVTTPSYNVRVVKVLKALSAKGRKIGAEKSTRFEWTIALSQLEEFCWFLPGFMETIDGFLRGVERVELNETLLRQGGDVERNDLCSENEAPGEGEIYQRCGAIYVCIRHEATLLRDGCVMVVKRVATKEEADCYKRSERKVVKKDGSAVSLVQQAVAYGFGGVFLLGLYSINLGDGVRCLVEAAQLHTT